MLAGTLITGKSGLRILKIRIDQALLQDDARIGQLAINLDRTVLGLTHQLLAISGNVKPLLRSALQLQAQLSAMLV